MAEVPALQALTEQGTASAPTILLMHGRGSDERDLFPLGRMLHPDATVISVRAPFDAAPWGYGPGFAWYRFLGGATPESESFEAGQAALAKFIDKLPKQGPLIVGGFSQGGTSALAYMMRNPGRVKGVMVFSGFLADHPSVAVTSERVGTTPIFWGHGTADPAIPFAVAEAGWRELTAAGANIETRKYPAMSHTISEVELRDAAAWLANVLDGENTNGAP